VGISKSYIHPIVLGKEVKQVEFGAKVNKIQIDGINFIEYIQYRAFNEGTRLQSSVFCSRNLTKTKIKMLGADTIYATIKNQTFTSSTNFRHLSKNPSKWLLDAVIFYLFRQKFGGDNLFLRLQLVLLNWSNEFLETRCLLPFAY